jgi:hypothetical protein
MDRFQDGNARLTRTDDRHRPPEVAGARRQVERADVGRVSGAHRRELPIDAPCPQRLRHGDPMHAQKRLTLLRSRRTIAPPVPAIIIRSRPSCNQVAPIERRRGRTHGAGGGGHALLFTLASCTRMPCASVTSAVTYERSFRLGAMVLRSAVSRICAAAPAVLMVFCSATAPLES